MRRHAPKISAAIAAMPVPDMTDWSGDGGRAGGGTWASADVRSASGARTHTATVTRRKAKSVFEVFMTFIAVLN